MRRLGDVNICRVAVDIPATLESPVIVEVILPKADSWRVCFAANSLTDNPDWETCLGNLARACDLHYVLKYISRNECRLCEHKLKKTRILHWITTIRELLQALREGRVPNPVITDTTWETRRSTRTLSAGVIFDGCRVTYRKFQKMSKTFQSHFDMVKNQGMVFPYLPHEKVAAGALLCFQLCCLYSNMPGVNTQQEILFACLAQAACPHFFPMAPSSCPEMADTACQQVISAVEELWDYRDVCSKFAQATRVDPV